MADPPPAASAAPLDAVAVWHIAQAIEYLRTRTTGSYVETAGEFKGQYILGSILLILETLRSRNLLAPTYERLEDIRARLASRPADKDGDVLLSAADSAQLADVVRPLSQVWLDFLRENKFVDTRPAKGMFDYAKLVSMGPLAVFQDSSLVQRLPSEVTGDISRASTAIARGVLTASVLLSLRAGEAMLRQVYRARTQKEPSEKDRWYTIADELFRSLDIPASEREELEGFVNGLRLFRNRAMHPGTTFGVRDAEDALVAVRQLIIRLDSLAPPR